MESVYKNVQIYDNLSRYENFYLNLYAVFNKASELSNEYRLVILPSVHF